MTTKFEDIIADYHKRNDSLIRKSVIIFITTFIFIILGMIVTSFMVPIPYKTLEAWQNWKPAPKFYVFALIEYAMLFFWLWLHLNFKLLQTKSDFLSDFVVAENKGLNSSTSYPFPSWTELENKSPVPKGVSKNIYWVTLGLLLLTRVMSLDRQYRNLVLIIALFAYEITAYFKGRVIERYLLSLRSNYIDRTGSVPLPESTGIMQTSLSRGIILATILTLVTNVVFQFSNVTNGIFFLLAFSGLCVAAFFLKSTNSYFGQIIQFADAVRVQENIAGPDMAPSSNWSIGQELKKDSSRILELMGIKSRRDKVQLLMLPIIMLLLAIVLWRLFQYVKVHGLN